MYRFLKPHIITEASRNHKNSTNGHNDTAWAFTVAFIWGLIKDTQDKYYFLSQFYR